MISKGKMSNFISILIESTKTANIEWDEKNPSSSLYVIEGEQRVIGKLFISNFKNQELLLFKYQEPVEIDAYEFKREVYYKLAFIDSSNVILWEFPHNLRELRDLYEVVQFKTSGLDKFFDDVPEPEKAPF